MDEYLVYLTCLVTITFFAAFSRRSREILELNVYTYLRYFLVLRAHNQLKTTFQFILLAHYSDLIACFWPPNSSFWYMFLYVSGKSNFCDSYTVGRARSDPHFDLI